MLLDLNLGHKKTLIDICEPAILHDYWSEDFLLQQLSL